MILLAGADLILPNQVLSGASLLLDDDRIAAIEPKVIETPTGATRVDLAGSLVVPGFVDVHVHGVEGFDVLDGPQAIVRSRGQAAALWRHRLSVRRRLPATLRRLR